MAAHRLAQDMLTAADPLPASTLPSAKSKIFVVSTRPPSASLSGGMAPAVIGACKSFDEVVWYAVGNRDSLTQNFGNEAHPDSNGQTDCKEYQIHNIDVKQILVDEQTW